MTDPLAGVFAGKIVPIGLVLALMLLLVCAGVLLTMQVRGVWRESTATTWIRARALVVVALAWTFVACAGFLTPRTWRTTDEALERIAQETAAADIWVTPNLVALDYVRRQNSDEFHTLMQRPEMRYLRAETRDRWINHNEFRRAPEWMLPTQVAIWQSWTRLTSRLTGKLHAAGVALLAGSDAGGHDGVLPGSSLHEELSLLVEAGLSPYEALKTGTVNPAIYLNAEHDVGKVAVGFRADLVLLTGNPLDDILNTRTRVGVMKRGRVVSRE